MSLVKITKCLSVRAGTNPYFSRGYAKDVKPNKIAVITGASRGIGFTTTQELHRKLGSRSSIYGTTRGSPEQLTSLIKLGIDKGTGGNLEFKQMEVTDIVSVVALRNFIFNKHGQIDILVNNAAVYFYPSHDPTEHYCQVQRTMDINYWGLKNVCNAFLPMLSDTARIVNLSSHLGHLCLIPGSNIKQMLGDPNLTEKDLDEMMLDYTRSSTEFHDEVDAGGWPDCAYTVSKVAVNAYTRILQRQLKEKGKVDIVVNSIHPGSTHSKICQDAPLTASDAAVSVASTAMLSHPCDQPRGKFIWHDLHLVDWTKENTRLQMTA